MEFLKELLEIQHELTIREVVPLLLSNVEEQKLFIEKYTKRNYAAFRVTRSAPSYKAPKYQCVQIKEILSTSDCAHNH